MVGETKGIPEIILDTNKETAITIPMLEGQRSLNLSNSVARVVYEAIRQNGGGGWINILTKNMLKLFCQNA